MKAQRGIDGGEMVVVEKKKSRKTDKQKIKNDNTSQSAIDDAW